MKNSTLFLVCMAFLATVVALVFSFQNNIATFNTLQSI